jgi:5-bromo-4-chloroindolyl phosphate hydrolysis protein
MHCPENNLIRLTIMYPMLKKKKKKKKKIDQELGLTLATAIYTGQE